MIDIPTIENFFCQWQKLQAAMQESELGSRTLTTPQTTMQEIEDLIFTYRGTPVEKAVMKYLTPKRTQAVYERAEVRMEGAIRDEVVTHGENKALSPQALIRLLEKHPPIQRTFNYASLEAQSASVNSYSRFVHIGVGALPETLLGIHERLNGSCPILSGVDIDNQAIRSASELLSALNLDHKIELIHRDGAQLDYSPFTHALVAVLVRPELPVIEQICATASFDKEFTVLERTVSPDDLGSLVYQPADPRSQPLLEQHGFKLVDVVSGHAVVKTNIYRRTP